MSKASINFFIKPVNGKFVPTIRLQDELSGTLEYEVTNREFVTNQEAQDALVMSHLLLEALGLDLVKRMQET